MNRRTFLQAGASAAIGALAGSGLAFAADAEIELSAGEPGAVISPHIYGHFIEHLGGVIYDGVWVGRNSSIPNVNGIRKQFVDDMKRIGAPNLRWPGGFCRWISLARRNRQAFREAPHLQLLAASHARRNRRNRDQPVRRSR